MATVQPLSANVIQNAILEARDIGYTIIPNFVDDKSIEELRQLCDQLFMPMELRDAPDPMVVEVQTGWRRVANIKAE